MSCSKHDIMLNEIPNLKLPKYYLLTIDINAVTVSEKMQYFLAENSYHRLASTT